MSEKPNTFRLIIASVLLLAAGVLPVHLLGALAPTLQAELNFNDAQLGYLVSAFFVVAALFSRRGGELSDRIGPNRALFGATLISIGALTFVAVFVDSYGWLLLAVVVAAAGNGVGQPGTNVLISNGIDVERRGLAFGAKQAGVPVSTLVGGISAGFVVERWGWRPTFFGAALVGVVAILIMPKVPHGSEHTQDKAKFTEDEKRGLYLLAIVGLAGGAAVAPIPAFLVRSAIEAGISDSRAPLILVGGSALLISVRVLSGVLADIYSFDRFAAITPLLLVGTVGYALLSLGSPTWTILGAAFAFSGGWGWPGLFNLGAIERFPNRPGAASGITQMGIFSGAVVGPALFGILAEHASYRSAWLASLLWGLLAVVVMMFARGALDRASATS